MKPYKSGLLLPIILELLPVEGRMALNVRSIFEEDSSNTLGEMPSSNFTPCGSATKS